MIASYPSTRAPVAKRGLLTPTPEVGAPQSGYANAFALSLEGRSFEEWFYQQTLAEREPRRPLTGALIEQHLALGGRAVSEREDWLVLSVPVHGGLP